MRHFVFLLLALIHFQQAMATDYYISMDGNDANPGSKNKPWRSIDKANATVFKAGDRILLQGGQSFKGTFILHEQSKPTPDKPITIGSFGTGKATILAGAKDGILIKNLPGIIIRDIIVNGNSRTENQGYGVKVLNDKPGNGKLSYIRIENVEASRFRWAGIYVGGIPTDLPGVEAAEGCRFGYSNVEIKNSIAYDNMYYGIYVSASWKSGSKEYGNENVRIVDCIAYENTGDPEYTRNHSGSGIMLDDTDGGLIEYCVSYGNGALNAGKTGGPCAIWTHASNQVVIQYCEAYANRTNGAADGGGFDLDGGVTNSIIQYCYSHDNDGAGYLMWNYEGAPHQLSNNIIRYCISAGDGRKHKYGAIHIGTSGLPITNIDVYHNTIYMPAATGASPKGIWTGAWGSKASNKNLRFFNNIIVTGRAVPLVQIESAQEEVLFAGNVYWNTESTFKIHYKDTVHNSLTSWQQAGQEKAENLKIALFQDPKLLHPEKRESILNVHQMHQLKSFRLQPNSPLLESGIDLSNFGIKKGEKDFWGNRVEFSHKPTIGAYHAQKGQ